MAQIPDAQLVEAAHRGDVDSFGELCSRHYACMVGVAYCVLSDHHLAEDAAQEAVYVALRDLRRLRRPEKFGPWVTGICRNVARKMAKQRRAVAPTEDIAAPAHENPGDCVEELVRQAVQALPASEREVVILRYYSLLSYEQIAAALEITERAVDGRLARAKRRIKDYLRRNGFGGSTS